MAKVGKMKKKCEHYKMMGRREDNKRKKQARAEARKAHFAERKAAGKCYTYQSNPFEKGTEAYNNEAYDRAQKNVSKKLPLQKWMSTWRKLNNEVNASIAAEKEAARASKKRDKKTV